MMTEGDINRAANSWINAALTAGVIHLSGPSDGLDRATKDADYLATLYKGLVEKLKG